MLIVTGYVHLDPADVERFATDIEALIDITRARDGCLFYAVALDDPLAGRMLAVERWRDQAALAAHLAAPETIAFIERWQGRMSGDVLKYDAANGRPLASESD